MPNTPVSEVMTNGITTRDGMPAARGSLWRFMGPRDLRSGQIDFGLSPYSGRINEIAVHPADPAVMYVTGATGGVWKTTDGGRIWVARSTGWPVQAATAVAIDPRNGDRVFVGTGDYKRLDHIPPFSVGVMRSTDGGSTWSRFGGEQMREFTVSRIVVVPADDGDSQTIVAATGRGSRLPGGRLFRSVDGGTTWDVLADPPDANWDDLERAADGTLWASATRRHHLKNVHASNAGGLLYRSTDNGAHWTKVNLRAGAFDLDTETSHPQVLQIAVQPGTATVFVAVYQNSSARVFVTADGGTSWTERSSIVNYPIGTAANPWAHSAFCATANRLYVGGVEMFRSGFDESVGLLYTRIPNPQPHSDFQCAVPDPTRTDGVLLGCDGGIYRHSPRSTTSLSATLGVTQAFRMDVHGRNDGLIALGTQDLGNPISFLDNGDTPADLHKPPRWGLVLGGDGRSAAFQQDATARVYLANTTGSIVGYDGRRRHGLQSSTAPDAQGPLVFSGNTLSYADVSFHRLDDPKSKDTSTGPVDWSNTLFPIPSSTVQSLAVAPGNTQVMYAGSVAGQLFMSDDRGSSWLPPLDRTGLPALPVWAIAPAPGNADDVVVALGYEKDLGTGSNHFDAGPRLFHKTDVRAPGPWTPVHGTAPGLLPLGPMFAILRHPAAPDAVWFASGDLGVFRTDDAGAHWANMTAPLGLPNTLVRDLRLSRDENTLHAATFGRGVWSADIDPPAHHFGVQGSVTRAGRPVPGVRVKASGAGRIERFLGNTLTSRSILPIHTTAPLKIAATATITAAHAGLTTSHADGVSLVCTSAGATAEYVLTRSDTERWVLPESMSGPVGRSTAGSYTFKITSFGAAPVIRSGFVDLHFVLGVSDVTAADGRYRLEYLRSGFHTMSLPGRGPAEVGLDLQANRSDVDFALT